MNKNQLILYIFEIFNDLTAMVKEEYSLIVKFALGRFHGETLSIKKSDRKFIYYRFHLAKSVNVLYFS